MRNRSISLLAAMLGTAAAAQTPAPAGPLPTRMTLCQQELQGLEGDARRAALRACLVRRAEAEPLVRAECEARLREVPADAGSLKRLQRDCEARALNVPSAELPRPMAPIPAPAPVVAPAADAPTAEDTNASILVPGNSTLTELDGGDRAVSPVMLPDDPQP